MIPPAATDGDSVRGSGLRRLAVQLCGRHGTLNVEPLNPERGTRNLEPGTGTSRSLQVSDILRPNAVDAPTGQHRDSESRVVPPARGLRDCADPGVCAALVGGGIP